ncbi:MAG: (2Fe-2S)-binding protein [Candidatus Eisenbacteria bacterium]|jgi:carbon-monoxide dehydrogenase small subunit|nr:(2Fe-2S)-binding protein [Candidatus Eisenbacteria bacterium]
MNVTTRLNGKPFSFDAAPGERLVDVLRDHGFMGTKFGCGTGECGACVVLLDGEPVNSCLVLAPRVEGRSILTIEGLGTPAAPHPLQEEFADAGAVQCGFCTPGMVLSAHALLLRNPSPNRQEVAAALDGNLCRCTGYVKIVDAVMAAAARRREEARP